MHTLFALGNAHLPAVSRVLFAIERVATVLNAADLFLVLHIAQIPLEQKVIVAPKVVTLHRTFAGPEAKPLGDATLLAALRKHVPMSTIERPTAVCNALALVTRLDAVLADVKALLLARNLAQVASTCRLAQTPSNANHIRPENDNCCTQCGGTHFDW